MRKEEKMFKHLLQHDIFPCKITEDIVKNKRGFRMTN